jgi:hypothetical protein
MDTGYWDKRTQDSWRRVGGGEKVRQFGEQKAPVEWLRLGYDGGAESRS